MRAHIAVGDKSLAWQVDEDALGILIWEIKDTPFIRGEFAHLCNGDCLYVVTLRYIPNDCQRTCCQEESTRARQEKAQCIAPGDYFIFLPGIGKFFAPLLVGFFDLPDSFCVLLHRRLLVFLVYITCHTGSPCIFMEWVGELARPAGEASRVAEEPRAVESQQFRRLPRDRRSPRH